MIYYRGAQDTGEGGVQDMGFEKSKIEEINQECKQNGDSLERNMRAGTWS